MLAGSLIDFFFGYALGVGYVPVSSCLVSSPVTDRPETGVTLGFARPLSQALLRAPLSLCVSADAARDHACATCPMRQRRTSRHWDSPCCGQRRKQKRHACRLRRWDLGRVASLKTVSAVWVLVVRRRYKSARAVGEGQRVVRGANVDPVQTSFFSLRRVLERRRFSSAKLIQQEDTIARGMQRR